MIAYTTIGVADMEKAKAFYNSLLADMGASVLMDLGRIAMIGTGEGAMLSICVPYDEGDPAPGNGNMVAITPGSTDKVDALYAKALELGGTSEGEPGKRMDGFYGAYFRDPDGNKICFCHLG